MKTGSVSSSARHAVRVSLWVIPAICCVSLAILCSAQEKVIIIDGRSAGRTFDGLGALSAGASTRLLVDYPEPQRSQILDYLFKPAYGAALQHLKVEVGSDTNSTDGSEPSHMRSRDDHDYTRGYEWWLMVEAHKRNPNIILDILPWGAPGWVGGGKYYSPDMAEYMADFIQGARDKYGLHIRYTGIWNETVYDAEYVKELHRTLQRQGLDTKIVCCDEYPGEGKGQWAIADEIQTDSALKAAVDVIGVHYPQDKGKITTTDPARKSGKVLWSSEDQPNSGGGPIVSRTWPIGGRILANLYNKNYLEGTMTKTEIWSPITSYYDILAAPNSGLMYANTPWSGYYDVQSTIWVTAHTTQFAQPGWQYLDSSSGYLSGKGTYVSLKSPQGKDWSLILETIAAEKPQLVNFKIAGGLSQGTVYIWQSNGQKSLERVADLKPKGGVFTFTFEPDSIYSLTTTMGQGKGKVQPPAQKPFPIPYSDDFESTQLLRTPKYLSDQDGAFEAHPCMDRSGQCLEQIITQKPIPWGAVLPDPFTLAGDVTWKDYKVAVDALLIGTGTATVMGRIDSADVFQDNHAIYPSGYILKVQSDGKWELQSATFKKPTLSLVSGTAAISPGKWHRLGLEFRGGEVSATLDGAKLGSAIDTSHTHGMFAIGTAWNRAQFDNLDITH